MSLENVEAFYTRLTNDEAFRQQIQNVASKEECSQIVKAEGYHFTQEELAEYTAKLTGSAPTEEEIQELDEKELATVFGGWFGLRDLPLMYGGPRRNEWF
jgi:predicted ribosomally synthesized peptide with nif11-like leader